MNYTDFLKIIKDIVMKHGLWKTAFAVSVPILIWQFANIVQAFAVLIGALK